VSDEATVDDGIGSEWKAEAAEKLAAARTERAADHVTSALRGLTRIALGESEDATIALHCEPRDLARLDRGVIASIVLDALIEAGAEYVAHGKDPVSYLTREAAMGGIAGEAIVNTGRKLMVRIAHLGARVALVKAREVAYEANQEAAEKGRKIEEEHGIESPESRAHDPVEMAAFKAFDDACAELKQFDIQGA
jgi:hypothetical protein